MHVLGKEKTFK